MSCLIVVTAAMAALIMFAWPALLMGAVLCGVTDVKTMAAIIIGAIVLGAVALRERLSGRRF
jgi:hypothetical protein